MPARFDAVTSTPSAPASEASSETARSTRVWPWSEQTTTA